MRGRRFCASILAAIVLAGMAACGGGRAPAFHPAGSIGSQYSAAQAGPARRAPGGFRFPQGVSIEFEAPLPGSPDRRAMVTAYRRYVLSLWAAALSHGEDRAYKRLASGNALTFAQREIAYFSRQRTIRGTIRYFNTAVGAVYFGHGATVTSCVDASAFNTVRAGAGATLGPVFPRRYTRYLEEVAEGRRAGGGWLVVHTQSFPSSTSQGAKCQ